MFRVNDIFRCVTFIWHIFKPPEAFVTVMFSEVFVLAIFVLQKKTVEFLSVELTHHPEQDITWVPLYEIFIWVLRSLVVFKYVILIVMLLFKIGVLQARQLTFQDTLELSWVILCRPWRKNVRFSGVCVMLRVTLPVALPLRLNNELRYNCEIVMLSVLFQRVVLVSTIQSWVSFWTKKEWYSDRLYKVKFNSRPYLILWVFAHVRWK